MTRTRCAGSALFSQASHCAVPTLPVFTVRVSTSNPWDRILHARYKRLAKAKKRQRSIMDTQGSQRATQDFATSGDKSPQEARRSPHAVQFSEDYLLSVRAGAVASWEWTRTITPPPTPCHTRRYSTVWQRQQGPSPQTQSKDPPQAECPVYHPQGPNTSLHAGGRSYWQRPFDTCSGVSPLDAPSGPEEQILRKGHGSRQV